MGSAQWAWALHSGPFQEHWGTVAPFRGTNGLCTVAPFRDILTYFNVPGEHFVFMKKEACPLKRGRTVALLQ